MFYIRFHFRLYSYIFSQLGWVLQRIVILVVSWGPCQWLGPNSNTALSCGLAPRPAHLCFVWNTVCVSPCFHRLWVMQTRRSVVLSRESCRCEGFKGDYCHRQTACLTDQTESEEGVGGEEDGELRRWRAGGRSRWWGGTVAESSGQMTANEHHYTAHKEEKRDFYSYKTVTQYYLKFLHCFFPRNQNNCTDKMHGCRFQGLLFFFKSHFCSPFHFWCFPLLSPYTLDETQISLSLKLSCMTENHEGNSV